MKIYIYTMLWGYQLIELKSGSLVDCLKSSHGAAVPDAILSAPSAVSGLGWWEGVGPTALWVARCEWGSAGLSAGVAGLPPAKEENVSPAPAVGISPRAEEIKLSMPEGDWPEAQGHRKYQGHYTNISPTEPLKPRSWRSRRGDKLPQKGYLVMYTPCKSTSKGLFPLMMTRDATKAQKKKENHPTVIDLQVKRSVTTGCFQRLNPTSH